MSTEGKSFLGEKKKRSKSFDKSDKGNSNDKNDEYHSPCSGDYLISNKSSSAFQIKHISSYIQFKDIISHLDYPSYTTDKKFYGLYLGYFRNDLDKQPEDRTKKYFLIHIMFKDLFALMEIVKLNLIIIKALYQIAIVI